MNQKLINYLFGLLGVLQLKSQIHNGDLVNRVEKGMGLGWITLSVNGREVNYFTYQHTIKEVFYAPTDDTQHIIHYELREINLMVEFDVEDELKILFGDHGVVGSIRANGMADDKVEYTINETEPHAIRATLVVRRRLNKNELEFAIINNTSLIIDMGVNLKDVINDCMGDKNAYAHDMSDKPIIMGY
ncbi:Uncharacterized protein TCM_014364 [Theobroma cacao]|uniref:Uncharacterized protein n=1 Tax=Theobroma cacao TaxID=3641 RepID=A0A061G568_THECC|nr:Uncharacterized protein TCM_014364 [Theobroma cacao]